MTHLLTWLLLPFAWLYAGVMAVRNWLYDKGYKRTETFAVPLINVGNLRVGGTGKTPHVTWLVEELLRRGQRPAILSRGYGRQTTGPRLAGSTDSAATVGDEPWQYYQLFGAATADETGWPVPVAVAEDRRLGVELLLEKQPDITAVILDDAYQHRAVLPALNILLTELARPFWADFVLPAGRLREDRAGAARADVVIITKCPPDLPAVAQAEATRQVRRYARPGVPVLFSAYAYAAPQPLQPDLPPLALAGPALLLTGIAQPGPLRQHLVKAGYTIEFHADFPDHYAFQPNDLAALRARWQPSWPIFTTAKDAARLQAPALLAALHGLPVYVVPIEVVFLGSGAAELRQQLDGITTPSARS